MPPPRDIPRVPRREAGVALVVVLSFIVLLTVVAVAYFSRAATDRQLSNSSFNQAAADHLARGAADIITADLRQEIADGSTPVYPSPSPASGTVYVPKTAANMVPQTSGIPTPVPAATPVVWPIPNLVRRSVRDNGPSGANPMPTPGVPSRASAVNSTTDLSANGRAVSRARWNSHYLLPRLNAGGTAIDSTPLAAFTPPDWVMVTKEKGPVVLSTPTKDAGGATVTPIGRYAYAIYDEGGLLDLNAAGFPAGLTTEQIGQKGALPLADLTVVSLTQAEVDRIVGWRNFASAQTDTPAPPSIGSFGQFSFTAANATAWLNNFVTRNTTGYIKTQPLVAGGASSRTDQMLLSRQQLLMMRRSLGFSQDALQYLGTFSRDLEQPSFVPDSTRPKNKSYQLKNPVAGGSGGNYIGYGGNSAYSTDGSVQDTFNPSLLTVRDESGRPVLKRRFPLSRLAEVIIGTKADPQRIKQHFGLVWDPSNCRWIYVSPDGPSISSPPPVPASTIKTLDLVALSNREPDFFETLKSVINCDSLGKQHGGNENAQLSMHQFLSNAAAIDGSVDYQVIQIGANLIDQYDEDSYPTRIIFDSPAGVSFPREFYGVENLPYMYGWMTAWYRLFQLASSDIQTGTYQPPNGKMPYETAVFLQPILWNPHAPDPRSGPPGVPTSFRVIAGDPTTTASPVTIYPEVNSPWWPGATKDVNGNTKLVHNYPASSGTPLTPDSYATASIGPIRDNSPPSYILFQTTTTGTGTFQEPYRLHAPLDPQNCATSASTVLNTSDAEENNGGTTYSKALGFYVGKCWTGPASEASPQDAGANKCLVEGSISSELRFHLQYRNPYGTGPDYLTYDAILRAYIDSASEYSTVASDDSANTIRGFRTGIRYDPRTDRWGLPTANLCPFWDARWAKWSGLGTKPSWFSSYPNSPVFYFPQGLTAAPQAGPLLSLIGSPALQSAVAPGWKAPTNGSKIIADVAMNYLTPDNSTNLAQPGNKLYYTDPDGVLRRGASAYFNGSDGLPHYTGNFDSRPMILNRAFRSVAEMGYAFRGVAWKDLDFFTPESGDSALLDTFCLNELDGAPDDVTVAGRVSLNTRQPKVLQAIIQGVAKKDNVYLSGTDSAKAAQALVNWTSDTTSQNSGILTKGPLRNRSELVGKWVAQQTFTPSSPATPPRNTTTPNIDGSKSYSGYSSMLASGTNGVFTNATDAAIKRQRECVLRALADSGNARTWNLLIDVVAQTGLYPSNTTDLSKFLVTGETRYWLHVAIDRMTGEVIAKQLEQVSE